MSGAPPPLELFQHRTTALGWNLQDYDSAGGTWSDALTFVARPEISFRARGYEKPYPAAAQAVFDVSLAKVNPGSSAEIAGFVTPRVVAARIEIEVIAVDDGVDDANTPSGKMEIPVLREESQILGSLLA